MSNISVFHGFQKPHISEEFMPLIEFLNHVKYGKWQTLIETIRSEPEEEKRKALKKKLPSVTISGLFSERSESMLIEHSGFICIDIDHFDDKKPFLEDPYTYSLMKSASGGGLAAIVKINPEKHKESFKWLQNYYYKTYGIVVDPAPQNVASLRFVSFDQEIYINEKSKKSLSLSIKEKKRKSLPVVIPNDKVGDYIREVVQKGTDVAPDYETYRNLGFALADGFGDQGRDYFHSLCSVSPKYNSKQANRQFDQCLKNRKTGITVGTFYWMLKDAGVNISTENKRLVSIVTMAKEAKRTKEAVITQLVTLEGVDSGQANDLVTEVFSRNDIDISKAIDSPAELIHSMMKWLEMNHPLRKNEITAMIEDGSVVLSKERINYIYLRARMFFNSKDITKDILESIIFSEFTEAYNPIQAYIETNSTRNSEGNIDNIIKSIRSDNPMKEVLVRKWLISIIAAYKYNPVRSVLALIGPQNCGKTEWFRRLLPSGLQPYYGESKLDAGKDDELLMCQKLILIDDEMGGKNKQDEKTFKELTSKRVFSLRAPYERSNQDYTRLAILGGTSNDDAILNDPTGNTRILPIKISSIDHELYNSVDKDELFMELFRAFESKEEWQLSFDEMNQLNEMSGQFEQLPFERQLIEKVFEHPDSYSSQSPTDFLTAVEVKEVIEYESNQKIINIRLFQSECARFFGSSKQRSLNGQKKRGYIVKKKVKNGPMDDLPF